ncbi:MAG: hypothetical protein D8M58_17030 [Calditrichaeota bacterium]|nr:MAG: hypothetical protein DWQ03_12160 [Calditrichota bacterium]MBL1207112.1 hypothetical protein [Calditrichota bacterium]NOG46942.1 hypothetical protein [Calditrichota bacterium]
MKKLLTSLIFFLFLSFSFAGNDDPTFTESSAQPDGNRVRISWVTKDESQLKHFIVKRSYDDKNFIELDRVSLKGPGYRYEYIDEDVLFKSSGALFYKIVAFKRDGTKIETASMMVHPNISGIFKTWGAIKAMFR